jgi:hypothetical protein
MWRVSEDACSSTDINNDTCKMNAVANTPSTSTSTLLD